MAISRIKTSSVLQGFPKSRSLLAGNTAYDPAVFFLIQRVAGTGSSGVITFSSIPSIYKHLQIRYIARSAGAGTQNDITFTYNSATSTYADHTLTGGGASATASANTGRSYMTLTNVMTSSGAEANVMGAGIVDIYDYQSTSKGKTTRFMGGNDRNGSGNINLISTLWTGTSAINTVTITSGAGNFTTTSTFALYGMLG